MEKNRSLENNIQAKIAAVRAEDCISNVSWNISEKKKICEVFKKGGKQHILFMLELKLLDRRGDSVPSQNQHST